MDYVQFASSSGGTVQRSSQAKPPATTVSGKLVARIDTYPSAAVAVGEPVQLSAQDSSGNPTK